MTGLICTSLCGERVNMYLCVCDRVNMYLCVCDRVNMYLCVCDRVNMYLCVCVTGLICTSV